MLKENMKTNCELCGKMVDVEQLYCDYGTCSCYKCYKKLKTGVEKLKKCLKKYH